MIILGLTAADLLVYLILAFIMGFIAGGIIAFNIAADYHAKRNSREGR